MNKKVIGIVLAIIVGVAGFLWLTRPVNNADKTASLSNHVVNEGSGKVALVEYGDFQCPGCASFYPILKQLKESKKDVMSFQFRNFPLEAIHQNARASARAAEAADKQGKFWEMHDKLFENQQSWGTVNDPLSTFKSYAEQIGITDLNKFETDYKSSTINSIINADLKEGQKLGVNSTPSFFLEGKKVDPMPNSLEEFSKLIDTAVANKTQ
jgi:protein-disulfide isomerase